MNPHEASQIVRFQFPRLNVWEVVGQPANLRLSKGNSEGWPA